MLKLFVLSLLIIFSVQAQASRRIEGVLLEKGTKKPLDGASVFILPSKLKAVTDSQGRFSFDEVPDGEFQWVVNVTGFIKLEMGDSDTSSNSRTLYLEKTSYQIYETTIFGREKKHNDTTRTLKVEKAMQMPGTQGDSIKAVQNLPGVGRTQTSQVVI
jgi:hypothetical protein